MKREQVRQSKTKSESASRREQKQGAVCRGKRCGWVNRCARLSGPERGTECCALSAHKSFQKASAFRHGLTKWLPAGCTDWWTKENGRVHVSQELSRVLNFFRQCIVVEVTSK